MPIDYNALALPKTPKAVTQREAFRENRRGIERDEKLKKQIARTRDNDALPGRGCRWPKADHDTEGHKCEGPLEMMHRVPKGMGGDKDGSRTSTDDLLQACQHIHQRSKDAVERHGRTWIGSANHPVTFVRRGVVVGVEKRIGVLRVK